LLFLPSTSFFAFLPSTSFFVTFSKNFFLLFYFFEKNFTSHFLQLLPEKKLFLLFYYISSSHLSEKNKNNFFFSVNLFCGKGEKSSFLKKIYFLFFLFIFHGWIVNKVFFFVDQSRL